MTYTDFIVQYSGRTVHILLEGKRVVIPGDESLLTAIGSQLARDLPLARFRSGNALGADDYFSRGVMDVAPNRMLIVKPYAGHRKNPLYDPVSVSLNEINLVAEEAIIEETKRSSKNASNMIDHYLQGKKDKLGAKASYLLRDTVKVLGTRNIPPVDVALFYDDLENLESGGTGHTMRVCRANQVPMFDQRIWMAWLAV